MLHLYAEYAATALDIFSVLTEAKRSDATARTLLSFSESLSRVTTLTELVQLLADTVPERDRLRPVDGVPVGRRLGPAGPPGPHRRPGVPPTPTWARSSRSVRAGPGRRAEG